MSDGSRVRVTVLANGLRVVTEAMPHVATAALGLWVGVGARNELAHEHGLSHFLEHMAFKGTRRRTARAIAEEIETAGGDLNAETGVEYTSYTVRLMGEDVPLALDILADILLDSQFLPEEIEREKNVVLQEINAVEDTPDDLVTDLFLERGFAGQPVGRPILGTHETVTAFDREAIMAFLAREYRAGRMVLAAAGAVDHDRIVADAERLFGGMPATIPEAEAVPAHYTGGEIHLAREVEQAHLLVGFPGLSFRSPDYYAMQVLAHVMGGGMSSRLFQEVRERRGLAYSIESFHWGFADVGLFGIAAGTAPEDIGELVPVLLECLDEAMRQIDETEVARARAQLKVAHLSALETPMARADQIARQLLALGRVPPNDEVIARLNAITPEHVRQVARVLVGDKPTLAMIAPPDCASMGNAVIEQLFAHPLFMADAAREVCPGETT